MMYAILLGVGMAACLSQQDDEEETQTEAVQQQENQNTGTTTVPSAPAPDPESLVIERGQAGNISIGMPMEEMRNNLPRGFSLTDSILILEGQQSTAYVLSPQGRERGLLVEQQCEQECRVWRINVLSPDFKTPEGYGVGSKYGEIKQAYPIGTVALAEGNFVAVSEEAGMSFVLDDSQWSPENRERYRYNPANIPENTLVERVILY